MPPRAPCQSKSPKQLLLPSPPYRPSSRCARPYPCPHPSPLPSNGRGERCCVEGCCGDMGVLCCCVVAPPPPQPSPVTPLNLPLGGGGVIARGRGDLGEETSATGVGEAGLGCCAVAWWGPAPPWALTLALSRWESGHTVHRINSSEIALSTPSMFASTSGFQNRSHSKSSRL